MYLKNLARNKMTDFIVGACYDICKNRSEFLIHQQRNDRKNVHYSTKSAEKIIYNTM